MRVSTLWIISGPDTNVYVCVCVLGRNSCSKNSETETETKFNRQFQMANISCRPPFASLRQIHTSINLYLHGYFCEFDIIYWSRYIFTRLFYTKQIVFSRVFNDNSIMIASNSSSSTRQCWILVVVTVVRWYPTMILHVDAQKNTCVTLSKNEARQQKSG